MSVKILDSFQNTVCNPASDEGMEGAGSGDFAAMSSTVHAALMKGQKAMRQIPFIHDAATDMRKRRRTGMH